MATAAVGASSNLHSLSWSRSASSSSSVDMVPGALSIRQPSIGISCANSVLKPRETLAWLHVTSFRQGEGQWKATTSQKYRTFSDRIPNGARSEPQASTGVIWERQSEVDKESSPVLGQSTLQLESQLWNGHLGESPLRKVPLGQDQPAKGQVRESWPRQDRVREGQPGKVQPRSGGQSGSATKRQQRHGKRVEAILSALRSWEGEGSVDDLLRPWSGTLHHSREWAVVLQEQTNLATAVALFDWLRAQAGVRSRAGSGKGGAGNPGSWRGEAGERLGRGAETGRPGAAVLPYGNPENRRKDEDGAECETRRVFRHAELRLPNLYICNIMVNLLSKAGEWERVEELHAEMVRGRPGADKFTYGAIIGALCRAGRVEEAENWLALMDENGCEVDEVIYSSLLKAQCREGRIQEASQVYAAFKGKNLSHLRVDAYTALMELYGRHHRPGDVVSVLCDMMSSHCAPSAASVEAVRRACGGSETGMAEARRVLEERESGEASGRAGAGLVRSLLVDLDPRPTRGGTAELSSSLASGASWTRDRGPALAAATTAAEKTRGPGGRVPEAETKPLCSGPLRGAGGGWPQPRAGRGNVQLAAYGRAGSLREAELLFEAMAARRQLDTCSCNTMMAIYGEAGRLERAEEIFHALGGGGGEAGQRERGEKSFYALEGGGGEAGQRERGEKSFYALEGGGGQAGQREQAEKKVHELGGGGGEAGQRERAEKKIHALGGGGGGSHSAAVAASGEEGKMTGTGLWLEDLAMEISQPMVAGLDFKAAKAWGEGKGDGSSLGDGSDRRPRSDGELPPGAAAAVPRDLRAGTADGEPPGGSGAGSPPLAPGLRVQGLGIRVGDLGVPANTISFHTIISLYFKAGCVDKALGTYRRMVGPRQGTLVAGSPSRAAGSPATDTCPCPGGGPPLAEGSRTSLSKGDAREAHFLTSHRTSHGTSHRTSPEAETHAIVIQGCAAAGLAAEAEEAFALMQASGHLPDVRLWSAMAGVRSRAGQPGQPEKTFRAMEEAGVELDLRAWGALVEGLGLAGKVEEAEGMVREMKGRGVEPNNVIYTSLMKMYGKEGKLAKAEKVLEEMISSGCPTDAYVWNTMIGLYGREQPPKVWEAHNLFRRMETETGGSERNTVSYCLMIDIFRKADLLPEAVKVARELRSSGCMDDVAAYNCLLGLYGQSGNRIEASAVVAEMRRKGLEPDSATHNRLAAIYKRSGHLQEAREHLQLALAGQSERSRPASPDVRACTTLISVYSQEGRYEEAAELWEEMGRRGGRADVCAYNAMISACGRGEKFEEAIRLFVGMQKSGLRPDVVTYTTMIKIYGRAGLLDGVTRMYRRMKTAGVEPNWTTYQTLINVYQKAGRMELAAMARQELRFSRFVEREIQRHTMVP